MISLPMSGDRDLAEDFDIQNLLCFETLEDSDTESVPEKTAGKKTEGKGSVFSQMEEEEAVLEKLLMEGEIQPWRWLEVEEVLMEMADEQEKKAPKNPEPRDKQKKSRKRGRKKQNKQVHSTEHYIYIRGDSRRGRSRALAPPRFQGQRLWSVSC
ncbi:uncharacterized protein ACNS7B_017890 [Menidia menidia]